MLSNYRPGRSLSVSAGVSGSYNHPAGVAKAIKVEVEKKGPPLSLLFQQATWGITGVWIGSAQDGSP
jgi:hypothetical protein